MKTISIRELHAFTGRYIRQAVRDPLLITERGQPLAILKRVQVTDIKGAALPDRKAWIARLPKSDLDSTQTVSEDRERS